MASLHGLLQGIRLGLFQVKDVVLERSQEIRKITLQNLCLFLKVFVFWQKIRPLNFKPVFSKIYSGYNATSS